MWLNENVVSPDSTIATCDRPSYPSNRVQGTSASVNQQLTTQQLTLSDLEVETVLAVVLEGKGNPRLIADIFKHRYQIQDTDTYTLTSIIKDHLQELKAQMEVVSVLELFSLMPQLHKTLVENLSNLEGGEAVTAYMKLMELITKQTTTNDINININDLRFKQAPRDLQRAYAEIEAAGLMNQVIEGSFEELSA